VKLSDYEKVFPASTIIFREGESSDNLCLLQKGKISLFKIKAEKRTLQKILTDGSFPGLEEFLLGAPYERQAETSEESVVLQLPRHLAESYLFANPKFLYELVEYLARRSQSLEKAAFLSKKTEGARLSAALWLAFTERGNSDVLLSPEETQEILSNATGLSAEAVGNFLSELERLEILRKSDRGLSLKSSEKLFRYAEYLEDKEHFE
jgi:CRP-like cAMP-binding protein